MSLNKNIKDLVTIFDHRTVEIRLEVPENLRSLRLLPSTLEKNLPLFFERCQTVTWSLLFLNYRNLFPKATKEQFFRDFVPTEAGLESFRETMTFVSTKLIEKPTVEQLKVLQVESSVGGATGESKK